MSHWTLKQSLELALSMEEESIQLYTSAQEKVVNPGSVKLLKELVEEEKKHKKKIEDALKDPAKLKEIGRSEIKLHDLQIVDYLKDVSLSSTADYQQLLIFAGKREKATHDLYMYLARKCRGTQIQELLSNLAQEELKHKYRLEREYDDTILKYM
jgi:hypothetical protein